MRHGELEDWYMSCKRISFGVAVGLIVLVLIIL